MQNEPSSSAEVLRRQFASEKLQIDDINGDHLIDVYANCTEMRDRPNFYRLERFEQQDPSNLAPIDNDGHSAIGVILETRDTPALTYVIRNAAQVTGIPICLFHSKANSERLNDPELQDMLAQGKLTVRELPDNALLARGYNAILMSQKFWEIFTNFQKVLIFQTDAICCPQSPYKLTDFLNFDYIGARWKRERPFGLTIDGGVGGLSLRDVQLSLECLRRFSPQPWPNGEDGYFAFHMELIGGKVAKNEDCAKFCTQNAFTHQSFGGHQLARLSISDHAKFMTYCPEAKSILQSMPRALRRATQDTP